MTATVPQTLVEVLRDQIKIGRYVATVAEVRSLKPGHCRACDTDVEHPAGVVVVTALSTEWTEPITRLDGWSTPCCWQSLRCFLRGQERVESFDGCTIEVPS